MEAHDALRRYAETVRDPGTARCEVCGRPGECELVGDGATTTVCDGHLVERFEAAFRDCGGPLVAYHPADEAHYARCVLEFVQAHESQGVEPALAALPAPCQRCGGERGDVLYVALEGGPAGPIPSWHVSLERETSATVMCRSCALDRLLPALRGRFDAVVVPAGGPGVVVERPG